LGGRGIGRSKGSQNDLGAEAEAVAGTLSDGKHDAAAYELDGRSGLATSDPLELAGKSIDGRDLVLGAARTT
jgi:hypothetical protein